MRRAAVEPELGHMKSNGLLERNLLRGDVGDMWNVNPSGAAYLIPALSLRRHLDL